jgi:hypothetical protein
LVALLLSMRLLRTRRGSLRSVRALRSYGVRAATSWRAYGAQRRCFAKSCPSWSFGPYAGTSRDRLFRRPNGPIWRPLWDDETYYTGQMDGKKAVLKKS